MIRRKAIKNIGLSFGAVAAAPGLFTLLKSCAPTEEPWIPVFFTEEEGMVVRKLVDTMLPAVDQLPAASELNVHIFIDKYLNEVMELEDRKMSRESLGIIMQDMLKAADEEKVTALKTADYESYLEANIKKTKEEERAIYEKLEAHLAANNGDASGLADEVRIYTLLAGMRGLAIWAYKTTEKVGETIMAYKPVPGTQRGCVDLQETTNGMAWSLG